MKKTGCMLTLLLPLLLLIAIGLSPIFIINMTDGKFHDKSTVLVYEPYYIDKYTMRLMKRDNVVGRSSFLFVTQKAATHFCWDSSKIEILISDEKLIILDLKAGSLDTLASNKSINKNLICYPN